jgi:hypothetical protein
MTDAITRPGGPAESDSDLRAGARRRASTRTRALVLGVIAVGGSAGALPATGSRSPCRTG